MSDNRKLTEYIDMFPYVMPECFLKRPVLFGDLVDSIMFFLDSYLDLNMHEDLVCLDVLWILTHISFVFFYSFKFIEIIDNSIPEYSYIIPLSSFLWSINPEYVASNNLQKDLVLYSSIVHLVGVVDLVLGTLFPRFIDEEICSIERHQTIFSLISFIMLFPFDLRIKNRSDKLDII